MGCNDKIKDTCGKKVNAKCVDFEGMLHANTLIEDCSNPNMEEVIEDINTQLDKLTTSLDFSGLGDACIGYTETDGKILLKDALLALEKKICDLTTYVGMPSAGCETCDNCSPLFEEGIACMGLDLGDLVDDCGATPTTFAQLLQIILTKINA